jgi:hypothetical protein
MAKLPSYIVEQAFKRVVKDAHSVGSSAFLFVGKCPLCEDWKPRMYLKDYNDQYMVYCHNCGYSHSFPGFIKEEFPSEWDGLKVHFLEALGDGSIWKKEKRKRKTVNDGQHSKLLIKYLKKHGFSLMKTQEEDNREKYRLKTLNYLVDRKIPEEIYSKFFCMVSGPLKGYVGIPFFNQEQTKILHVQGRLIIENPKATKKQPKYLFLKDEKEGIAIDSKPL